MIKALFIGFFRLPNLLMVAMTMYLMRWSVIKPILEVQDLTLQVPEPAFLILVLSTLLITAAGYVINDYHDAKTDRINRPETVAVDRYISRRKALLLHWSLNIGGVITGSVFAIKFRLPWLIIPFAVVPFVLWYYSFALKHRMVLGNILVSLLTASVPLLALLFEYPLLVRAYQPEFGYLQELLKVLVFWTGMFAFFAFMTSFILEIVKDAEEMKGDEESGSRTVPLAMGLRAVKITVISLSAVVLAVLGVVFVRYLTDWISLGFYVICFVIPFIWLIVRMVNSRNRSDFHFLGQLIRIIMLLGLLYAPIANLMIRRFFSL